jgi:hypothetical protein
MTAARHRRARPEPQPIFTLKIEGKRDSSIRALRALLKILLRRHGFKCIDAREDRGQR